MSWQPRPHFYTRSFAHFSRITADLASCAALPFLAPRQHPVPWFFFTEIIVLLQRFNPWFFFFLRLVVLVVFSTDTEDRVMLYANITSPLLASAHR